MIIDFKIKRVAVGPYVSIHAGANLESPGPLIDPRGRGFIYLSSSTQPVNGDRGDTRGQGQFVDHGDVAGYRRTCLVTANAALTAKVVSTYSAHSVWNNTYCDYIL